MLGFMDLGWPRVCRRSTWVLSIIIMAYIWVQVVPESDAFLINSAISIHCCYPQLTAHLSTLNQRTI